MNKVFDFLKNTGKAGVEFVKDKNRRSFLLLVPDVQLHPCILPVKTQWSIR